MVINQYGLKETLKLTGPAVGAASGAEYAIAEVVFEQGDAFFAHTDGLTDTMNPTGEYFSEKELIPLFSRDQSLSLLLEQIQSQIKDYSTGAKQIDDITMLAVRRKEK
jgi:sigma-B regulation protein RsbU (phosphoserine phosphatase)